MSEQSQGVKETLEVVKAVELVGIQAKKVLADGKVNGEDLPAALELVKNAQTIIDAVEGITSIDDEMKDLDEAEAIQVGMAFFKTVKAIKKA